MGRLGRGARLALGVAAIGWLGVSLYGLEAFKNDERMPWPVAAIVIVDAVAAAAFTAVHFVGEFGRPTRKPINWWHSEWVGMAIGPPALIVAGLGGLVDPGDVSRLVWWLVLVVGLAAGWLLVRHVRKPVDHDRAA